MHSAVNSSLNFVETCLDASFGEYEIMLGVVSSNIREMILEQDAKLEDIEGYLRLMGKYGRESSNVTGFFCVFGVFDIFDGAMYNEYFDIRESEGFVAQERPWYIAAVESPGKKITTNPYLDAITTIAGEEKERMVFTYAIAIQDNSGKQIAVIGIDVLLDPIYNLFSEYNHGGSDASISSILLDGDLNIIAHPLDEYLGVHLRDAHSGISGFADVLESGERISNRRFTDYKGDVQVLSLNRLGDGWYLGMAFPIERYYESLLNLQIFFFGLGVILAFILCLLLVNINRRKTRAEEQVNSLFESMPLCSTLWDSDYNSLLVNDETVKFFKLDSKQEYHDRFFKDLSPENQPDGQLSFKGSMAAIQKAFDEGYCKTQWMHQDAFGEPLPCEVTLMRINAQDELYVAGYARDLRGEREHRNIRSILEMLPIGVRIMRSDGELIYSNKAALDVFNCKSFEDQVEGKSGYDFMPEFQPDGRRTADIIAEAQGNGGEISTLELQCLKIGGEAFIARVTSRMIEYKGDICNLAMIEDMTAENYRQQTLRNIALREQEANRQKSAFIANISHEIRTPMNTILGITNIQMQNVVNSKSVLESFAQISSAGELLLNIINEILDIAKIEAGKMEINPQKYDIPSLINDTMQMNNLKHNNDLVKFSITVAPDTPLELHGDDFRIRQILNNLISNSFKYTRKGGVSLDVSSVLTDADKSQYGDVTLVFRISDTGQGMSEEQLKEVYDEFTRFNHESNRGIVGTGLGMSITKRFVEMMHGNIEIESVMSKGTVFTVKIPQVRVGKAVCGTEFADRMNELSKKVENAQITRECMPYGKVLIVDDVSSNIRVAEGMLVPYELQIETAASGFEALEIVEQGKSYDIVFMDHMMPLMDGMETVKKMREIGYKEPIVALTANAMAGQAEQFLRNGFDDFVSKPIDSREMDNVLNKYIRDRHQQNEKGKKKVVKQLDSAERSDFSASMEKAFLIDAKNAVRSLETVCNEIVESGKFNEKYIVTVHGMKSALLNVGEADLSAVARRLEHAGQAEDMEIILGETADFIDELKRLIEKFSPQDEGPEVPLTPEETAFLRGKLLLIVDSCEMFDNRVIKKTLDELMKKENRWPKRISTVLDEIFSHLLHSAFAEAGEAAGNLAAELQ